MENGDDSQGKFQHVLFCFSITLFCYLLAARSPRPFLYRHSISIGSILSLLAGGTKEIVDELGFSKDAVADLLGILIAVVSLYISKPRLRPNQKRPSSRS